MANIGRVPQVLVIKEFWYEQPAVSPFRKIPTTDQFGIRDA
jgi:hypothetical protein